LNSVHHLFQLPLLLLLLVSTNTTLEDCEHCIALPSRSSGFFFSLFPPPKIK
jgi:hypothetical protein